MSMLPPPPQPPVHTMAAPSSGPGRKWYLVPILLLLLVGIPSLMGFLSGLKGITDGLTRMRIPGQATVDLEPGTWTIFYESTGEFEGETFFNSTASPGMDIAVRTADGDLLSVTPSVGSFEYNVGGHSGQSIAQFRTDHDGEHQVSVTLSDPNDAGEYLLAFGRDLGRFTFLLVMGVIGMIASGALAFAVWLIVFILRYRARSRMAAAGLSSN